LLIRGNCIPIQMVASDRTPARHTKLDAPEHSA
jgi:hypothetical protein